MKMEQQGGVASGGAHQHMNHSWGDAVPGHGVLRICKACGEKETEYTKLAECIGRPATGITETTHDYDPID
jgi:cytochrome c2